MPVLVINLAPSLQFADGAWSLRKVNSLYGEQRCISVRRTTDNEIRDIYFDSSDQLDVNQLIAFVTEDGAHPSASGYLHTWYDQSTDENGTMRCRDLVQSDPNQQYCIVNAGVLETLNGHPALRSPDANRGMTTAAFAPQTTDDVTLCFVGALSNSISPDSPRYVSMCPTNPALDDTDSTGLGLLSREGCNTPTENWAIQHNNSVQVSKYGSYGRLDQVTAQVDDTNYSISINGGDASVVVSSLPAFNFSRYGLSHSGLSPASSENQYVVEVLVWNRGVLPGDLDLAEANQILYWQNPPYLIPASSSSTSSLSASSLSASSYSSMSYDTTLLDVEPQAIEPQVVSPNPYTLVAEDTFNDNIFRTANFGIYNYGTMTSRAGAWMASEVSVVNQKLRLAMRKVSTPITINGTNYYRIGGACLWKGPSNSAFKRGGTWECRFRIDRCAGFGFAVLLWPQDPPNWPTKGEIDMLELYSNNTAKFGGESNFHLDTVLNSGRHLKCPTTATRSPTTMVSAGNFQVDWTQFHTLRCLWIPDERIEMYIDDVLVGSTTDQTYVPHGANAVPMRLTLQTEAYGTSDSAADSNTHYAEVDFIRYYSLVRVPTADLTAPLNALAGTTSLTDVQAANAIAGTTGLPLLDAINYAAGATCPTIDDACNAFAETVGLTATAALQTVINTNTDPMTLTLGSTI